MSRRFLRYMVLQGLGAALCSPASKAACACLLRSSGLGRSPLVQKATTLSTRWTFFQHWRRLQEAKCRTTGLLMASTSPSSFLGVTSRDSNREGVIVYMGEQIFGVKWKDWKVLFKENPTIFGATDTFDTPRVYNLLNDPHERESVLFPHTWAAEKALPQLQEHIATFEAYPPIPPGTPDPYEPPIQ